MHNIDFIKSNIFQNIFSSKPLDVLSNEAILEDLYQSAYLQIKGILPYNPYIQLKIDIIENYLLYLDYKSDKSKKEEKILSRYKIKLIEIFSKYSPDYFVSSKIFKYYKSFFADRDALLIQGKVQSLETLALNIFHRFSKKEEIYPTELNLLFEYLTNNIDTTDQNIQKIQKAFITWMLNSNTDYGIYSKNCFLHYFAHQFCLDNKYSDIPVYISDENLFTNKKTSELGIAHVPEKVVIINPSLATGNSQEYLESQNASRDVKLLQSLFHELRHIKQYTDFKDDITLTTTVFIMLKNSIFQRFLSTIGKNEYYVNYQYREIERDANLFGWVQAFKALNEYAPSRIQEMEMSKKQAVKNSYEQSIATQFNLASNKRLEIEFYNVTKLSEIVAKNPYILEEYPALCTFYYDTGKLKTLTDLVSTCHQVEQKEGLYSVYKVDLEVFDEFFKVIIVRNGIDSFPLTESEENQITWFNMIYHLYKKEIECMKQLREISSSVHRKDLEYFCKSRKNYIEIFRNYLIKNKQRIRYLKGFIVQNKLDNKLFDIEDIEQKYEKIQKDIITIQSFLEGSSYGKQ